MILHSSLLQFYTVFESLATCFTMLLGKFDFTVIEVYVQAMLPRYPVNLLLLCKVDEICNSFQTSYPRPLLMKLTLGH